MLEGYADRDLDDQLRNALQDRAARDTIRQVHLRGAKSKLFSSVISSLSVTTKGKETRTISVESFIVRVTGTGVMDVSAFFSQHRLPKLQCLHLSGYKISSWDLLKPQTAVLTTLELADIDLSPIPTPSQSPPILPSNPLLQHLVLSYSLAPVFHDDGPCPQVTLRHLKRLRFDGSFYYALRLLTRLELPDKMDDLSLFLHKCSPHLLQMVGPCFWYRVRCRDWLPAGGLWLSVNHGSRRFIIAAGDPRNGDDPAKADWFAKVTMIMSEELEDGEAEEFGFGLIAHIPWEQVTDLRTSLPILRSEELCVEMCRLAYLRLIGINLSTWFIETDIRGPRTFKDLLPGLDRIEIVEPTLGPSGWSPLTNFLTRRAAVGNQISSLRMSDHPRLTPRVVDSIKRAVGVFECLIQVVD